MQGELEIIKALSDRNRLRIVAALSRHIELCACQITEVLQVTGATASRHLSVLQNAGLVTSRKDGRWVYYSLARPVGTEPVFQWLEKTFQTSEEIQADFQTLEKIIEITREDLCRKQRGDNCCP
jgi:DNA-binding transcriptional ArsR family regulator